MTGLWSNVWFIGALSALANGLLVTLLTRYFFLGRHNAEYSKRIIAANLELLGALRPSVSEGTLPAQETMKSLIAATARKHSVEEKDMYSIRQITEDLTQAVMNAEYLPATVKNERCDSLSKLRNATENQLMLDAAPPVDYRKKWVTSTSLALGITAGLMSFVPAFVVTPSQLPSSWHVFATPSVIALFSALIALSAIRFPKQKSVPQAKQETEFQWLQGKG